MSWPDALVALLVVLLRGGKRPDRARHFGRLRHGHHVGGPAAFQPLQPGPRLLAVVQHAPGAVYEQGAQVRISALGDAAQADLATCTGLRRHQPQPGTELAPRAE